MDINTVYLLGYYNISNEIIDLLYDNNINEEFYIQCLLNNENNFKNRLDNDLHKKIINNLNTNCYQNYYFKIKDNNLLFSKSTNLDNSIKIINSFKFYFKSKTNLNLNGLYNDYNYDKILRVSFLGDNSIVNDITNKINIPFYGITNDINDPKYIESFNNNQLLPIEHSWFFHSQYSLIYNNYFEYFDILFHSILTLTIPIFIGDSEFIKAHILEIIELGFDIDGIIILKDLDDFISFTNSVKWDDYNNKNDILLKNKNWIQNLITNFINGIKIDFDNDLILNEDNVISKKIIKLVYPEESFILNMIYDLKSNKSHIYKYDLKKTVKIIKFIKN